MRLESNKILAKFTAMVEMQVQRNNSDLGSGRMKDMLAVERQVGRNAGLGEARRMLKSAIDQVIESEITFTKEK